MELIAHTPPKVDLSKNISPAKLSQDDLAIAPHTYHDHIQEMLDYGMPLIDYVLGFVNLDNADKDILRQTYKASVMLHDLGKLDDDNQAILQGERTGRLPIDHIDSGVAIANEMNNQLLAWVIRGHHAPGLVNMLSERSFSKKIWRSTELPKGDYWLRGKRHKRGNKKDEVVETHDYKNHYETIAITQKRLNHYKKYQIQTCGDYPKTACELPQEGLTTRIMLSCLVDADHTSTANYHRQISMKAFTPASTNWQARLDKLVNYVSQLNTTAYAQKSTRNQLRHDLFQQCLTKPIDSSSMMMCSASVGLGKTTAVSAYLLRQAIANNASRFIIIAPFTNILTQTVKTLRKAMIHEGEDAEEIVIEHHHKVDFSHKDMRQYASSWDAPIIVTTAVQFFETLASANPTLLKKLHNVVGSVIFIDESHACLPPELLAVSWKWLKTLSEQWGCKIVFSSGSMVEFWNNEFLVDDVDLLNIPELMSDSLLEVATELEQHRLDFEKLPNSLNKHQLITHVVDELNRFTGAKPCTLVILNTTQSTAFIAYYLSEHLEENTANLPLQHREVLHLSTVLTPSDRTRIIDEILRRQTQSEWDNKPWYLVATSCVEAGIDLDFQFGYRERCSLSSFIQVSGRINRHGKRSNAKLYDFVIEADGEINLHPSFKRSREIFEQKWQYLIDNRSDINKLVTNALQNYFLNQGKDTDEKKRQLDLIEAENKRNFQTVNQDYKVISSDTYTVITNPSIVQTLQLGYYVDWKKIQNHSVQLWFKKIQGFELKPIANAQMDDVYSWTDTYDYNDFLGIFAGVINVDKFFEQTGGVW